MSAEFEEEVRWGLSRAAAEAGSTATLCRELARRDFRPRARGRQLTGLRVMPTVLTVAAVAAVAAMAAEVALR